MGKFAYYRRLSVAQKRIYDKSDVITRIDIPPVAGLENAVCGLRCALESGRLDATQATAHRLVLGLCRIFRVPPVIVKVMECRPSRRFGELHGLYSAQMGRAPTITVWMRTAKRGDVVAFRTFLRTMTHELLHHLDYMYFKLADSFHTEGFFRRESSVVERLLNASPP